MSQVAYDPDFGPVEVVEFPATDRKRWAKAENWGAWLAYPEDGADHYHEVWMLRLGSRVRFVARGGKQYGPQHNSVVAATYFAFAHGWRDPAITAEHNTRCIAEARNGGVRDEPMCWRCDLCWTNFATYDELVQHKADEQQKRYEVGRC